MKLAHAPAHHMAPSASWWRRFVPLHAHPGHGGAPTGAPRPVQHTTYTGMAPHPIRVPVGAPLPLPGEDRGRPSNSSPPEAQAWTVRLQTEART